MGVELEPLEFSDCLTDSPQFRENLHKHEEELYKTNNQIKKLTKEVKDLLNAAKNLSRVQRAFADSLQNFSFECIGGSQTDDEMVITHSLKQFAKLILAIEDERDCILKQSDEQIIVKLQNFRKQQIGSAQEEKKKFDKQTSKFCQTQEKYLNASTKKKQDNDFVEADAQLDMAERYFCQASLDYVFRLQEVQERKKFEFVEIIVSFMISWLTFYHQGYEIAKDFQPYMTDLQLRIQKTRQNFIETRNKTETLKQKMLEMRQQDNPQHQQTNRNKTTTTATTITNEIIKEGYLFLMEKKAFVGTTTWAKHYCVYNKATKEFSITPFNQLNSKTFPTPTVYVMQSCVRRMTDTIEKRFCFDIVCTSGSDTKQMTLQALSEDDRKAWMDIMDGKEPTYSTTTNNNSNSSVGGGGSSSSSHKMHVEEHELDDMGFQFVRNCIEALESRGLEDEGLYRIVGVTSKVQKLLTMGLDRRKPLTIDCLNSEWETKTITSALKTYLRTLNEPIMTYKLHNQFIAAAKKETREERVNEVHRLVYQLPNSNIQLLQIIIQHLKNVSDKSNKNLMPISNLAVCFGPTLLKPEEETVASIIDLKFYNVVVELLIDNYHRIFKTPPPPPSTTICKSSPASPQHVALPLSSSSLSLSSLLMMDFSPTDQLPQQQSSVNMRNDLQQQQRYSNNIRYSPHQSSQSAALVIGGYNNSDLSNDDNQLMSNTTTPQYINKQQQQRYTPTTILHYNHSPQSTMNLLPSAQLPSHQLLMLRNTPSTLLNESMLLSSNCLNTSTSSTTSSNESVSSISHGGLSHVGGGGGGSDYSYSSQSITIPQKNKRTIVNVTRYPNNYRQQNNLNMATSNLLTSTNITTLNSTNTSPLTSGRSSPCSSIRRVRTLYKCVGENDGELSFQPNQIITNVKPSLERGWLIGTLNGKTGLVPENYVEMLP